MSQMTSLQKALKAWPKVRVLVKTAAVTDRKAQAPVGRGSSTKPECTHRGELTAAARQCSYACLQYSLLCSPNAFLGCREFPDHCTHVNGAVVMVMLSSSSQQFQQHMCIGQGLPTPRRKEFPDRTFVCLQSMLCIKQC